MRSFILFFSIWLFIKSSNAYISCTNNLVQCYASQYFDGSYCVPKLYLLFYTNYYTQRDSIKSDDINLFTLADVRISESPEYSIYILDMNYGIYKYSGNYVKHSNITFTSLSIETIENGNVYASSMNENTMYYFDTDLNLIDSPKVSTSDYVYNQYQIRYDTYTKYLYQVDGGTKWINAFDLKLNRNEQFSFSISPDLSPYSIAFYNKGSFHLVFIGLASGQVFIFDRYNVTSTKQMDICSQDVYLQSIVIDELNDYILFACPKDNAIKLWTTDGANHLDSGRAISIFEPQSMDIDSYGRLVVVATGGVVRFYELSNKYV